MNRRDLALIAETRAALEDGSARRRRELARIRVVEMAAACGATPAAVSQWERKNPVTGRPLRVPGAEHALAYWRALAAAERKAAQVGHKTGRKPAPLEGWDIPIACAVVLVVLIVWGILAS